MRLGNRRSITPKRRSSPKIIALGAVLVVTLNAAAVVVSGAAYAAICVWSRSACGWNAPSRPLPSPRRWDTGGDYFSWWSSPVKVLSTQGKVRLSHGGAMSGHAMARFFFSRWRLSSFRATRGAKRSWRCCSLLLVAQSRGGSQSA